MSKSTLVPMPSRATRIRSQCLWFRGRGSLSRASELDAGGIFGGGQVRRSRPHTLLLVRLRRWLRELLAAPFPLALYLFLALPAASFVKITLQSP
jgi:hypothetical protein